MKRALLVVLGLVALGTAGLGVYRHTRPTPPPNVLIVLWDTVRADRMSLYGHDVDTTPNLEKFAESAVVYDNAVSPGMWTVPSHGSMFTGLPPSTHGASFEWRWLDNHHTTFAEYFRDQGYETYAFSANPNLSKRGANLLQGFDTIQNSWLKPWWPLVRVATRRKLLPNDASTEISPSYAGGRPGNPYYNGAPATGRAFFKWVDSRSPNTPWLAYLNYMEAHKPRVPALRHRRAVMDEDRHELALQTDVSFLNQMAYGYGQIEYTDEEMAAIQAVYDACLHELDEYTDRLLKGLEKRGILDDTIVVLTSDHGEALGEHHRLGHRYGMYQSLLHVPLVIHYPPKLKPARVSEPVTTQDLFATLTELAGLPAAPSAAYSKPLTGTRREDLFSEVLSFDSAGLDLVRLTYPQIPEEGWERTFRSVRSGDLKLIVDNHDEAELFDVAADPQEEQNLASERPDAVAALREKMRAWWEEIPEYDPSKRTRKDRPVVSRKEKSMLEVLGYVVDDDELEDAPEVEPN